MWLYQNFVCGGQFIFETKKEALKFIKMSTNELVEAFPNDPDSWVMLGEDIGTLEEVSIQTAEEAFAEWWK